MRNLIAPVIALALALAWAAHVASNQNDSISRAHAALKGR
jgi:hypothetical protein